MFLIPNAHSRAAKPVSHFPLNLFHGTATYQATRVVFSIMTTAEQHKLGVDDATTNLFAEYS